MAKSKRIVVRNPLARLVRSPGGPFRSSSERDRTKYTRKTKHKKQVDN
jgi:hypothetical protein